MLKDSKIAIFLAAAVVFSFTVGLQTTALLLGIMYILNLFFASSNTIAFREFTLVMYAVNYLLSPSILYNYNDAEFMPYRMELQPDEYFSVAIPGIFAFHFGLFLIPTKIFSTRFSFVKLQATLNEEAMKNWLKIGLVLNFSYILFPIPGELAFFILLLSGLRYVGLFGLLTLDAKKYKYHIALVGLYEFYWAFRLAFFHDLMIWIIFFGLYYVFLNRITISKKLGYSVLFISFAYVLQNFKGEYRNQLYNEEVGDYGVALQGVANSETFKDNTTLFSEEKVANTLVRINQAWIAASSMNHMNLTDKFCGTLLLSKYLEAAFLPRFLAPDKLQAGNKEIFNEYSGHKIAQNTSMALGIVADGYIAFKFPGVLMFCFGLGFLFCTVFKIAERWGKISPFFVLLLFPILYYAVRPDCELQTTLGQLVKGTFTFWLVVRYYKDYFMKKERLMQKIEQLLEFKRNARN